MTTVTEKLVKITKEREQKIERLKEWEGIYYYYLLDYKLEKGDYENDYCEYFKILDLCKIKTDELKSQINKLTVDFLRCRNG